MLRDASSLTKQSYVEFDLDDIFDNQRYADFRLFFLTVHASRFAPIAPEPPQGSRPQRTTTRNARPGDRSRRRMLTPRAAGSSSGAPPPSPTAPAPLDALRDGVAARADAPRHRVRRPIRPTATLRDMLADAPDADQDLHRALLRIAYRLIVLFVAEDRDLLHTANRDADAEALYTDYLLHRRLTAPCRHPRRHPAHRSVGRTPDRHRRPRRRRPTEHWRYPDSRATLFDRDALGVLAGAALPNRSFLAAVRALARSSTRKPASRGPSTTATSTAKNSAASTKACSPTLPATTPPPELSASISPPETTARSPAPTTRRPNSSPSSSTKRSTRSSHDALRGPDPEKPHCSPSPWSILQSAAAISSSPLPVRIATALATVRTGDSEPGPQALRAATADVIERCIYGVDVNDLAIEITKVALWLEAFDGSRPFPFLDAHLKVGNSLLGTTPALLRDNIPDAAFTVLGDDNKTWTSKLKARNKAERARDARQLSDLR